METEHTYREVTSVGGDFLRYDCTECGHTLEQATRLGETLEVGDVSGSIGSDPETMEQVLPEVDVENVDRQTTTDEASTEQVSAEEAQAEVDEPTADVSTTAFDVTPKKGRSQKSSAK